MARPRSHLARAPIVEAVIDFRVLAREGIAADQMSGLLPKIGQQYEPPSMMHRVEARFGIERGKALVPTQVEAPLGWVYQCRSQAAVAQFRVDGFTFSKLEPYTTWEEVFGEARRLWKIYVQVAQPLEVSRLAVRYINRLRLPAPADLGQYLSAPPVLPEPIPQTVREFLTRVVVDAPERGISAILIQALERPLDPSTVQVLLDIDAFRESVFPAEEPSLLQIFEQLRKLKNEIFFASLTERTVEMYDDTSFGFGTT
ncbi:MAG: TIGR04255 family protein [Terriglobales bacterium]|jgi:uncharacterized protein (TIGR04255 family)